MELEKDFSIYPFTTENIGGYILHFDLKCKNLLTVGSSTDQMINASLYECYNQTLYDLCPFSKYYFYLKYAGINCLTYKEFLEYFYYKGYITPFKDNKNVFSKQISEYLLEYIKKVDNESFNFWKCVFEKYTGHDIRNGLFSLDESRMDILIQYNPYLNNDSNYKKIKQNIKNLNPKFYSDDIANFNLDEKYDNIFLSNIGDYYKDINEFKLIIDNISKKLNDNGSILVSYLFDTTEHSEYRDEWSDIYNLPQTRKILGEYITEFITFTGVKGILLKDENSKKDSALIYRKG